MSREVMVFMIPSVSGDGIVHRSSIRLSDLLNCTPILDEFLNAARGRQRW